MEVDEIDAKPPGDDARPVVKSEPLDKTIVPSKTDTIVKSDMDVASTIETSTTAETSTLESSNKPVVVSARVTRSSKRLKIDAGPVEGSTVGNTDQAKFFMDLLAIKTGSGK
jgi:hypothetical protein